MPRFNQRFGRATALAAMIVPALALLGNAAWSQTNPPPGVQLLTLAPVPPTAGNTTDGGMYSWDISFVDPVTQMYYLADRSNKAIDVVDAKTGVFINQISANPPFAGFTGSTSKSGPNGVVAATLGSNSFLFVTDSPSRVVSINANTGATISSVTTGSPTGLRADELAFDPVDNLLLVINNADTPPFAVFIPVNPQTGVLSPPPYYSIVFDAAHGVDAQNGAEQPQWEPVTQRFYLSIPQIGPNASLGGVLRINPALRALQQSVEAIYYVQFCSPAGMAVGPNADLFIGCNTTFDRNGNVWDPAGTVPADPRDVILSAQTGGPVAGNLDANVYGVGPGDEVYYNAFDNSYYASGSGSPAAPQPTKAATGSTPMGVVGAASESILQLVPTLSVKPPTPAVTGLGAATPHSVAANGSNGLVFVATGANNVLLTPDGQLNCLTGCVAVYGRPH